MQHSFIHLKGKFGPECYQQKRGGQQFTKYLTPFGFHSTPSRPGFQTSGWHPGTHRSLDEDMLVALEHQFDNHLPERILSEKFYHY